jgi:hypothetical protein
MRTLVCLVLTLGISVPCAVTAQTARKGGAQPDSPPAPKRLIFEESERVTGAIQAPDGTPVLRVARQPGKRLHGVRQSFVPELLKSAEDL